VQQIFGKVCLSKRLSEVLSVNGGLQQGDAF
jgi:hypothetical protein